MGAPVKGNTLLNYFGVSTQYIDYLLEKKIGTTYTLLNAYPIKLESKETLIADTITF